MNRNRIDELEQDREWLRAELEKAGQPELPPSLSAEALFARMDKADAEGSPTPQKENVIALRWKRWGSLAAVLVLAVGVTVLLRGGVPGGLSKDSSELLFGAPQTPPAAGETEAACPEETLPDNAGDSLMNGWEGETQKNNQAAANDQNDAVASAPAPNPSTAGDGAENPSSGELREEFSAEVGAGESILVSPGPQPVPDLTDFDAMATVSSRLMGKDYDAVQEMLYPQNAKQVWQAAVLPAVCSHYFMLDKTLYGYFPEELLVADYHSGTATVLTAQQAARLGEILQIA